MMLAADCSRGPKIPSAGVIFCQASKRVTAFCVARSNTPLSGPAYAPSSARNCCRLATSVPDEPYDRVLVNAAAGAAAAPVAVIGGTWLAVGDGCRVAAAVADCVSAGAEVGPV